MTALAVVLVLVVVAVGSAVVGAFLNARVANRQLVQLSRDLPGGASQAAPGGRQEALAQLQRAVASANERAEVAEAERTRLEQAISAVSQGVLLADDQGNVIYRNAMAAQFASARHSDALVEAEMSQLLLEAVAGLAGSRSVDLFGPPRRTVVLTALPFPTEGGVGALGIIEDISELRHLEAVRRDFVANISHELKTPVGAVGLLAETLMAEEDPVVVSRLAERIQSEAFRVARTIDDLLELSRIESGEASRRERVAVHLVVAEAVERMRPAAEQADISILVSKLSSQLTVLGDRRQLVSAVFNLLDNAAKYSDPDSVVEVYAGSEGRDVTITVEDHGIGIPARDIERIFERFYRVDQARSRQTGGTGLGLAIVRHVMGNHEGQVRVESRLGEGSTFTLSLPKASEAVVAEDAPLAEVG